MSFRFHHDMPLPGTRAAPIFDDRDHRTLLSFFDTLDDLFVQHSITDDQDRKQYVLRYFPLRESDMCETLDEFDAPTPYSDFVAAIIALYPGITRSDMTLSTLYELIEMRRATPIQSCEELATFYREFLACSSALLKNGRLATFERTPLFVKALREDLATRIRFRLEILQPDRAPDHVFDLETVYQAALFILRGSPEISKLDQTSSTAPGESPSIVATLHRALESLEKITAPLAARSCESRPRPASVAPPATDGPPMPSRTVLQHRPALQHHAATIGTHSIAANSIYSHPTRSEPHLPRSRTLGASLQRVASVPHTTPGQANAYVPPASCSLPLGWNTSQNYVSLANERILALEREIKEIHRAAAAKNASARPLPTPSPPPSTPQETVEEFRARLYATPASQLAHFQSRPTTAAPSHPSPSTRVTAVLRHTANATTSSATTTRTSATSATPPDLYRAASAYTRAPCISPAQEDPTTLFAIFQTALPFPTDNLPPSNRVQEPRLDYPKPPISDTAATELDDAVPHCNIPIVPTEVSDAMRQDQALPSCDENAIASGRSAPTQSRYCDSPEFYASNWPPTHAPITASDTPLKSRPLIPVTHLSATSASPCDRDRISPRLSPCSASLPIDPTVNLQTANHCETANCDTANTLATTASPTATDISSPDDISFTLSNDVAPSTACSSPDCCVPFPTPELAPIDTSPDPSTSTVPSRLDAFITWIGDTILPRSRLRRARARIKHGPFALHRLD